VVRKTEIHRSKKKEASAISDAVVADGQKKETGNDSDSSISVIHLPTENKNKNFAKDLRERAARAKKEKEAELSGNRENNSENEAGATSFVENLGEMSSSLHQLSELQPSMELPAGEGSEINNYILAAGSSLLSADLDNVDKLGELSSFSGTFCRPSFDSCVSYDFFVLLSFFLSFFLSFTYF
jgi:hypothetical protein